MHQIRNVVLVAVAAFVLVAGTVSATKLNADGAIVSVFTSEEISQCGKIRIPQMTVTPKGVLLAAQCRNANGSSSIAGAFGDDMVHAKVVTKFSPDNGTTWGPMQVLTPLSHSHGQVVYDRLHDRVLLHYQYHPSNDPTFNSSMFQRTSIDCCGSEWSETKEITELVAGCNPHAPSNMQVGSAGSKIQTSSGRIIFLGHSNGTACRWWTDDGGDSYNTSEVYVGNEASVAEYDAAGSIYMNARGLTYPWKGNRTSYWSSDSGTTFTAPVPCSIEEDAVFGCSAGLAADPFPPKAEDSRNLLSTPPRAEAPYRLFFSEPAGPNRQALMLHCSFDGGHTWPSNNTLAVDGESLAAYSALRMVKTKEHEHRLLVVWEHKDGFKAQLVDTAWCRPS